MNKTAIKNFAIAARLTLIDAVTQRAFEYEVTENGKNNLDQTEVNGKALTSAELSQRRQLINRIQLNGFSQTIEEAAYTWFNRFIDLRFMEVNGYLPTRIRVFTDENNAFKPEILAEASRIELDGIDHDYMMVDDKNMVLSSLEGVLYNKEKTILLIYPSNKEDDLFDVPDTVKEVDSNAFSNCLKLTKIIFPEATEEIKGLGEINKLEEIVVDERNPVYSSSNGVLYDKEKVTLYAYPCNKKSSVFNAPETLENVEYGAFEGCYNLKSIIFPDTTTNIASLSGAENLTYFVFPKEMEIIPQDFFGYTNTVETVIIQENISVIENGAFEWVWINNVYYTDTEEQWGEIMILPENDGLSFADIHYDYDIKNEYY